MKKIVLVCVYVLIAGSGGARLSGQETPAAAKQGPTRTRDAANPSRDGGQDGDLILGKSLGRWSELLKHPDPKIRLAAALYLGQGAAREKLISFGARQEVMNLVKALADLLADGEGPEIREAAISTLHALGPLAKEAIPALIGVLRKKDDEPIFVDLVKEPARTEAARTLSDLGLLSLDPLLRGQSRDKGITRWVPPILGKIGPKALDSLVKALNDERASVRVGAAEALGDMGPDAVPAIQSLAALMGRERDNASSSAAHALGKIGAASIPVLSVALKDSNPFVRSRAVYALGVMSPESDADILPGMKTQTKPERKWGPELDTVLRLLLTALRDRDFMVGAEALGALGRVGGAAVPSLIKVLKEGNESDRLAAIEALGTLGSKAAQALPELLALLEQNDDEIAPRIVSTLGDILTSMDRAGNSGTLGGQEEQRAIAAVVGLLGRKNDKLAESCNHRPGQARFTHRTYPDEVVEGRRPGRSTAGSDRSGQDGRLTSRGCHYAPGRSPQGRGCPGPPRGRHRAESHQSPG